MNPNDPIAIEAQKKRDMELFEKEISESAKKLPGFTKKEFTFTSDERQFLAQQDTIRALSDLARDHIINEYCLSRVGIQHAPELRIAYSVGLGRFVVFIPKEAVSPDSTSANTSPTKKQKS